MALRDIEPSELTTSPFDIYGHEWGLVSAGGEDGYNTMTVSWGALGTLWNRDVATVYVRPERHTHQFMESSDRFTVSFFGYGRRRELGLLGTLSGRDCDKVAEAGLTPVHPEPDVTTFEEARLVLVCRKLYAQPLDSAFLVKKEIDSEFYGSEHYHVMYVGEVERVLVGD